ncbi:PREDICTED: otogelin [Charadrius vociferus]|uniref:otogelin n=1 Tax=Charadrius vociferus TaxID=50402 RepID=UPI00052195E1|nr:PREDICTED: otogelin [Charadrius vociferus]
MAVYNTSSTTISLSWNRRLHNMRCGPSNSFTCFNGGECVYRELCNCSRFNATGPRCQTVYNTGAERDHICRTWGQHNFETFDGLYYYFSGKSTYALVRHTELDEQSFSIQVNNDPECYSSPYSCKRSISLYFSGDEQIKMSSEVTYKGFGVQLPYMIGNLHIQKLAGYFLVRHQYAFTLAWDGTSAVYIKMAPEYLGKTRGLCGNNNAILQDDLETSYGKLTDDVTEFGESWQENPPQGTPNWDKPLLTEPPCLTQSHESLQRAYTLCNVLLHPPFEQCHEYVSPLPFMASCTNDLCMSAVDNATWCRALTEYARACAQAGKPLHGWRMHLQQCVITCAEPLSYNECINCCPVSCQQSQCIGSELPCIDGCYCPDGLIYENGLCVKPMDCPCDYHGSFFEMGSVVYEECNNCTCIGGKWICTNLTCPAECSVSGDIHFMTFDGRKYTFQATCQYILAKSRTSGMFTISLQNAPCGQNQDGSCVQSITLILKQDPKRQVTLTHSGDVLVYDQYKINLPYADELFEIRKLSSVFLQVKTHIGLQILYDRGGLRLYLQVDGRWKDDTVGLCGTFNGNTEDDFLSPVGVTESTPELFGNTWKTSSACVLVHDSSQMDPCDIHLQAASYAAEACSILTKELFAPCYPYLSPVPYFEQCRRDTCKCGQICFCSALAHYAHHCRRFGVIIDFRGGVPDCALSCEDTKEYSTCVSTCGRTCQALSVPETCSSDCVEGCACPSGMYLNSKTERCVQRNECPCYFQGIDYPPGENVITSVGKCLCRDGVMSCDNNVVAHSCPVGQIYINCSNPQVDPELSRERTCENQLLNLTFSAHLPCISGCVCPLGLVKHGDVCLDADECPCSWKGKEYFPGDKVISTCHTCICQHGSFQCTFHPCPSMCTAYGDRHYRTFDGLTFDFVGTCKVYLVKGTSSTSLSVVIENINCFNTGIICRKNIFINVGKTFLIFDDETGNPSLSSYIDELQKMQLWKAGFFTVVHFPDEHITILWDQRTTVHVQMGHQWQGELTGLCGNFDLKTVNELRTPDNFEFTNSQEFGNSWTAVECVDSSDIRNPCSLNPLREPFAKKECGILLSEAFEACHPVIDVTWFYSNCLTDTCGCNQGGDCECFCTSVSAYAHQCCQHGVAVDWRSPRVCPYDCEYFNRALGKGPYKLVSYLDGGLVMAVKLVDGVVFPVREENTFPRHAVSFMLTSGLYKPKAHDSNLISFEMAERPNYFLQLISNNTLVLSKWKKSEEFHNRSTFVIHKNTWLSGYSSFESFAKPGYFIHISASSVELLKYHHSEEFRLSTLFKLVDVKFKFLSRSACEWHYDACTTPCFKTCRDPLGKNCQAVPKVEGCIPACPLNMLLDEITQRCVYFEDCIEPADDSALLTSSIRTPAVSHITSSTSLAVISEAVTSFPVPEATDMETTLASKLQLTATAGKPEFSAVTSNKTLPTITLSSNISSQSTEVTSGRSTTAMSKTTKSNVSLSSPVDISPSFPSTVSSQTSTKIQLISSASTKLLRATEPQTVTATGAVTTSTESESKPISTFIFTGTPLILKTTEMPVKTEIMEISEIATRTLPTKEAQVKPEELTTFTPSSFESITDKTTVYLPQFSTSPPLGMPSYTPPVNLTGTSEGTKISVGQSFTTVANVTVTSFSPVFTTSLLKPVSSATTKAAIVLTEQSVKTTFLPTSTPPISLGKEITEPPIEMVQHLTGTAEVPFTTTQGLKTTTLQTQERSSETTLLSFTTHKKETPKTVSHVEHTSSSYFPPYSLHPSSTTEKSITLSTKRPSVSVSTPASPASGELKKTFKTVSTTGYPSYIVLNTTEFLTTLYTKYPVVAETIRVTPLSVEVTSKITSPFELAAKSTLFSRKMSTEYKSSLVSSTVKTSTSAYSGSVTTSAVKTSVSSKETTTVPSIATERESAQRTSFTGSPLAFLSATETTLLTTQPDKSQVERITSISTRKPSAFPSSPSSSLISLNVSLPSLPSYGKEASLSPLSTVRTSHVVFPVTKSSYTFSTSQYLADKLVSSPSLTQMIQKVTTTLKYPVQTKVVSTALKSTVRSVTDTVKLTAATAQPSFPPSSVGPFSWQTSSGDKLLVQTTKTTALPRFSTQKAMELSRQTSEPSLTSQSSTPIYRYPAETLTKSTGQPQHVFSTTEATVESTSSYPLITSLPEGIHSTASLASTTQTSKLEILSEVQTPSVSSLLMISDYPNDTTAPSVSSFAYLSTKPLHGLTTTFSDGLGTAEAVSGVTASSSMLPRETATLQTCTPITENECIKHICLDGQLIQVNKSQNCPYNATQPSCGVLGFATQMNGDKCCPKWECACRCTIFSDLSIITYDGNHLALFKEASYVVSQTQDETITIHILDCRMSNSNSTSLCLAMLNLTYVSNQIIINRLSRKITVNSRFAWPTVRKYGYKVEDSGFKYAVETPTKIRIQWFHNTGVMIIEFNSTREPRALGLCGFCDRSLENDLMLPNRTVLSKSNAPSAFIDSWQVPDTLKYVGEDRHQETNCSVMDCSECLRMVLNQTFSSCHPYVPPELFCDIWVQDTEYIQNPCISLAAYVAMCNKFNICIEWRSSDYCPFPCSENFSYQACIAACEVADSCQNNEVASLGSDSCSVLTEGCVCAEGTILHRAHTAVCIPEEKCACTDSSGAPRAVGEIWKTSSSGCCMQKCVDSETIIPVEYNCSDIHNLDCQRFAEVALLVPGDQTCCPQKICICNQSLCESLIPECDGLEKLVTYYSEESCCPNYVCECDPAKCEPMEQMPSCRDDQTLIAARVESTCCISYICACEACSDQLPKCQEGEVLIVDGNTTERCCPTYQCVCEIHRCPEFKCMLGMSLVEVWSPEKCCPFRTCECACETIPKPQCKLGQKLQIDEQFQNSTENICNCVKYKCVRDKVCLSNERGVLLPGQTIVEHSADGICHISYCTNMIDPSTKYYRINMSSIDCAVKCKANQVYQPPKDLTTCCGSCKNLSCLHTFSNGTVSSFKPGTVWISNCIRYECTNTAVGPVLVSSSVGCPPFNETECVKVGGYVVPFLEGCCKTCKEDGKFCKKVTVRMTIRKNDCRSNTPVNIVSCDGKCPSASIYNYNINTYARFCKCCRELGLQRRTVQLYCTSNSTWVSYTIQEPTDCSCQWS